MTHRLLVNPDTPQAWEIPLPPGTLRIGRRDDNHHQIDHPSVSGAHCEVIVDDTGVQIKDLGSTNGTFVNREPVREARLTHGQHLQLGNVDMRLETVGAVEAPVPAATAAVRVVIPSAASTVTPRGPLRLARSQPAPVVEPPEAPPEEEPELPPMPPPLTATATIPNAGQFFCKSHPKTQARFLCPKCRKYFCELCVMTRATPAGTGKFCRTCGATLTPLQVRLSGPPKAKGFFSLLPGTVVYPFRGSGVLMLIAATLVITALQLISMGLFGILMKIAAYGYLFSYMQNLIYATASEEAEMPELPGMDDLFGSCFRLVGTVLISFGLAIGLAVARFMFDVDIPMIAIIVTLVFGCLYFPMAFLAVAMKDTALAANPLIVVPAILKVPLEYLVTVILMACIFGLTQLGNMMAGVAVGVSYTTRDMSTLFLSFGIRSVWCFVSVYLLTVNMRILGLLYVTKKSKLAWFSH